MFLQQIQTGANTDRNEKEYMDDIDTDNIHGVHYSNGCYDYLHVHFY